MAVSRALGGAVKRREDRRLVTGAGQYTDDVRRDGCLHAVFVRSPHAHARITTVDVSTAQGLPGQFASAGALLHVEVTKDGAPTAVDARDAYRHSPDRAGFLAALNRQGIDTSFMERLANG